MIISTNQTLNETIRLALLTTMLLVGSVNAQVHQSVLDYRQIVKSRNLKEYSAAAKAVRLHMIKADPYRPLYHFTGVESWINDPNGPIYYNGKYHLFYQFDPQVPDGQGGWIRSKRCWGHAVSNDLVHWEDWPVAIWPDTPHDRNGVYSGNTFIHNGQIHALYTGNVSGHRETHGILAWTEDGGLTFKKKTVMPNSQRPNPHSPVHWDAQVWKEGQTWYQLIGGATVGNQQGAAWLWSSSDLNQWKLEKNVAPSIKRGRYWELPYLIPLDGRYVLMVGAGNPYWIGDYDKQKKLFTPQTPRRDVDTGHFYSFNPHMVDDKGPGGSSRRIMHGWARIGRPPQVKGLPYWESAHSIPRVITIKHDRLWQEPIPELQCLRYDHKKIAPQSIPAGQPVRLSTVRGDALEIIATFKRGSSRRCGLIVRADQQGNGMKVWADAGNGFGIGQPANRHFLKPGEPVTLRVFVDRGVLEVYCNGVAVTHKCFAPADRIEVFLFSDGGTATLQSLEAWKMKSIWLPPVQQASIKPGRPMDYSRLAFYPKRWKQQKVSTTYVPWEGKHVVFLTNTAKLDNQVMAGFVGKLDAGWQLYADLTGRKPRTSRQWKNKSTIAAVPKASLTCGYGCGYVGATGIEVAGFYNHDYPLARSKPDAFAHYYFYEMGRNFYTFGDRHSLFVTGYAVFMRYVCMETLNLEDPDKHTGETIEICEAIYAASDIPFLSALTNLTKGEKGNRLKDKQGRTIVPSDQPVMYATVMLKLRRDYGGNEWVKRFFGYLSKCPEVRVRNESDAMAQSLNWLVSASAAAKKDLTPIFVDRWRMPLDAASRKVLEKVNWNKDNIDVAEIISYIRK